MKKKSYITQKKQNILKLSLLTVLTACLLLVSGTGLISVNNEDFSYKNEWKEYYHGILSDLQKAYGNETADLYEIYLMDMNLDGVPELHFITRVGARRELGETKIYLTRGKELIYINASYGGLRDVPQLCVDIKNGKKEWISGINNITNPQTQIKKRGISLSKVFLEENKMEIERIAYNYGFDYLGDIKTQEYLYNGMAVGWDKYCVELNSVRQQYKLFTKNHKLHNNGELFTRKDITLPDSEVKAFLDEYDNVSILNERYMITESVKTSDVENVYMNIYSNTYDFSNCTSKDNKIIAYEYSIGKLEEYGNPEVSYNVVGIEGNALIVEIKNNGKNPCENLVVSLNTIVDDLDEYETLDQIIKCARLIRPSETIRLSFMNKDGGIDYNDYSADIYITIKKNGSKIVTKEEIGEYSYNDGCAYLVNTRVSSIDKYVGNKMPIKNEEHIITGDVDIIVPKQSSVSVPVVFYSERSGECKWKVTFFLESGVTVQSKEYYACFAASASRNLNTGKSNQETWDSNGVLVFDVTQYSDKISPENTEYDLLGVNSHKIPIIY